MPKFFFFLFFICTGYISVCQTAYPYQDIKLEKPSDYKETESLALSAASFLLSTPFKENDVNRERALAFLTKWISGVKDFEFNMKGKIQEFASDRDMLTIYVAAMVKYSLENKSQAVNPKNVDTNSCKLVLQYCDDPKNNFKLKKKYRKVLEAE